MIAVVFHVIVTDPPAPEKVWVCGPRGAVVDVGATVEVEALEDDVLPLVLPVVMLDWVVVMVAVAEVAVDPVAA